jgi:hypothetical protein
MTDDLVVDLQGRDLSTLDAFWDAVAEPCGLPAWFGRNLDAWWDTVESRGISPVIDVHDVVVVRVIRSDVSGLFAPGNADGERLARLFAEATRARLELC